MRTLRTPLTHPYLTRRSHPHRRPTHRTATVVATLAAAMLLLLLNPVPSPATSAGAVCSAMSVGVRQRASAVTGGTVQSTEPAVVERTASTFTVNRGIVFAASDRAGAGLVRVRELTKGDDRVLTVSQAEVQSAISSYGYADQGTAFWASATQSDPCLVPVYRFVVGQWRHALASQSDRAAYLAAGYREEGIMFWASPASAARAATGLPTAKIPGWVQIYAEDFNTPVAQGGWLTSRYVSPWGTGPGLHAYTGTDTSGRGTYDPAKVLSVTDSKLTFNVRTEGGKHLVSAVVPKDPDTAWGRRYGRYSFRFRADQLPNYKFVGILWPDSDNWAEGEVNFPEVHSLDQDHRIYANLYKPGDPSTCLPGDHATGGRQFTTDTLLADSGWHIATIEWGPGRLSYELDGKRIGEFTSGVPNTPMHLVLQVETSLVGTAPADYVTGAVEIDWVTLYALES